MKQNTDVRATSIHGVCQMYGLGETTVERALRQGALPFFRVGRRIVIRIADVEKWIGTATSSRTTS
jgi:excisionase family DNA binding protein